MKVDIKNIIDVISRAKEAVQNIPDAPNEVLIIEV